MVKCAIRNNFGNILGSITEVTEVHALCLARKTPQQTVKNNSVSHMRCQEMVLAPGVLLGERPVFSGLTEFYSKSDDWKEMHKHLHIHKKKCNTSYGIKLM